jgi:hypothetical protein
MFGLGREADLASVGRLVARRVWLAVRLASCSLCRFCRKREHAPRFLASARRCPPSLVGFLARIWASRFASGDHMKLNANLEAPFRKTPTSKKPRDRPTPGGSAEGAGGLSHALLDPQQATLRAKNRASNAKSAPLPNAKREVQGGPRTTEGRAAGGQPSVKRQKNLARDQAIL